jgi:hypothetical protein
MSLHSWANSCTGHGLGSPSEALIESFVRFDPGPLDRSEKVVATFEDRAAVNLPIFHDAGILARWLGKKTAENIGSWVAQSGNSMLVAVASHLILAAGSVTDKGVINLDYVSPEARFRSVSRALMFRFYLSAGYTEDGPASLHVRDNRWLPDVQASGGA